MALSNRINFRGGQNVAPTNLLGQLDSLTRTYPSNTTATAVNRTFVKNSYVAGMMGSANEYKPNQVTNITFSGNAVSFYTYQSASLSLVLSDAVVKGATYKMIYSVGSLTGVSVNYFSASGAFTRGTLASDGSFTVPSDAEYVLINIYNGQAASTLSTFTLTELKRVA